MNKITSINGTLIASLNELNEHVENGTAHVTEEERTAWNNQTTVKAKGILIATQEDLDEHTGNWYITRQWEVQTHLICSFMQEKIHFLQKWERYVQMIMQKK